MESRAFLAATLLCFSSWCSAEDVRPLNEKLIKFTRGRSERCATFSPDGRTIATAQTDGESVAASWGGRVTRYWSRIRLWDVETGDLLASSDKVPGYFQDLQFLPDGKSLVAARYRFRSLDGTDNGIVFWSVSDGSRSERRIRKPSVLREAKILSVQPAQDPRSAAVHVRLAVSSDGEAVAASESYGNAGNTSAIRLWQKDSDSKELVSRKAGDFYIQELCFSSDGRVLVTHVMQQSRSQGFLVTGRDTSDLERVLFQHAIPRKGEDRNLHGYPGGLAAIPGSSLFLFGSLTRIGVFDIATGTEQHQIDVGFDAIVEQIVVSHDGRFAAASSQTSHPGKVVLIDLASRRVLARQNVGVQKLDFSPDDRLLALSGPILLWDVSQYTNGEPHSRVDGQ